jgi:hypothetical protein
MSSATIEQTQAASYEIAQAIAPTWERRRAQIEEVSAPVREWMVRELAAKRGDTTLELAAGAGDTGFDAAQLIGDSGHLISKRLLTRDAQRRTPARERARRAQRRVPSSQRRADRARRRFRRRHHLPLRIHADLRSGGHLARSTTGAAPGGRLVLAVWGNPDENPFFTTIVAGLMRCGHRPPLDPTTRSGYLHSGKPGEAHRPFARRRVRRTAHHGGAGHLRAPGHGNVTSPSSLTLPVRSVSSSKPSLTRSGPGSSPIWNRGLADFATRDGFALPGLALCAKGRSAP